MPLAVAAHLVAPPLLAQTPLRLFDDAGGVEIAAAATDDSGVRVLRARVTRLRPDHLGTAVSAGLMGDAGTALELNLFADATFRGVFERYETDALGHQTWVGRVEGDPRSTITLTWRDETVVGGVQTGNAIYRVRGTMSDAVVDEVDPTSFGEEREPIHVAADQLAAAAAEPSPGAPMAAAVVDVLVYYTTAAKNAQGGTTAIQALIATAIADTNTAYARSGLTATVRLVSAVELAGYVESSDMVQDLYFIQRDATVAAARNAAGADLVALIVASSTGGVCGVGYLGPSATYAHSVTARNCIVGNYTFAHELGHNFGSHHAPEDGASNAWKSYGYGYKDATASFRTVMAYPPGARLLSFSNPSVLHNGRATGNATQNNARSLSEALPIVQGFRGAAAPPPPPPPGPPGPPQNVAHGVSGQTVALSWSAPATGTPTGYQVRVGTAPGAANVFSGSVGALTSVSAPFPSGTYYVRVHAQNAAGTGPASNEVTVHVNVSPLSPPGPPRNLAASVAGSVLTVSWQPPAGGGAVATYRAQVGTAPGGANVFNGAVGAITSATAALGAGTYYVRIYAQNAAGVSVASNEVGVTIGSACTVPAAPVLSGSRTGNTVGVAWTTPAGGPVVGYTVEAGPVSGSSAFFNGSVGAVNGVSATVGSGSYYVRVFANAACGRSASSNEVLVTVP